MTHACAETGRACTVFAPSLSPHDAAEYAMRWCPNPIRIVPTTIDCGKRHGGRPKCQPVRLAVTFGAETSSFAALVPATWRLLLTFKPGTNGDSAA
eukprot:3381161-Rhodomonas_salina.1